MRLCVDRLDRPAGGAVDHVDQAVVVGVLLGVLVHARGAEHVVAGARTHVVERQAGDPVRVRVRLPVDEVIEHALDAARLGVDHHHGVVVDGRDVDEVVVGRRWIAAERAHLANMAGDRGLRHDRRLARRAGDAAPLSDVPSLAWMTSS